MTDITDKATDIEEFYRECAIAAARGVVPPGKPGECELCGEWSGRLINGECAPCRDRYNPAEIARRAGC